MSAKKKLHIYMGRFFLICLLCLCYSFIEPYWLETKTWTFYSRDLPRGFSGTKVVFVSDIHHGPFLSRQRLKSLVKKINALKPDLIILGGDYVHRDPKYIEPCFTELKKLNAPMGKYGVLGNHDHWEGTEPCKKGMRAAGIVILDNASVWLFRGGERIKIGGVGFDNQNLSPTIRDTNTNDLVILLSHTPDYIENMKTNRVDLVLSGHTHGGQCTVFGLWAPLTSSMYGNKYRSGVIKNPYATLLVTNGVGTITPPVRFFAKPQINVIILRKQR